MRCLVCGTLNPASAKFCSECGIRLESITCPTCGAINRPDAKFCNQCGSALAIPSESQSQPTAQIPSQETPARRQDTSPEQAGGASAAPPAPNLPAAPVTFAPSREGAESLWTTLDSEERRVV